MQATGTPHRRSAMEHSRVFGYAVMLAVSLAMASVTAAQDTDFKSPPKQSGKETAGQADSQETDRTQQARNQRSRSKWYGPGAWFTAAEAVDQPANWWDFPLFYDDYYAGYYDGYVDGYGDDAFGYDFMDADRLDVYGVGYTEGYYDGFYDQSRGLKFDPYYYVFDYDDLETSEERRGDVSRSRAERQREASGERARRMQESEAQYYLETDKIRGTLSGMERVSVNQRNDHMTLRLSFEDHDDVIADFGPRIRKDDLPVVVGDRVTITGRMRSSGGHDVLVAHSLRADGQTMRIMRTAQQKMRAAQIKQREQPDPINLRERRRSARMDKVDPDRHQESLETLRGVVQSVELVEREAADKRQIAELTLEDGRTRLVDLGRTPNKIGIETGDRIRIRGRFKQLGQQRVFVAQRCFVNDEPVQLARDH